MARRGGLGRGLDSLIPDRVSQRKRQQEKAEEEKKNSGEKKETSVQAKQSEELPREKTVSIRTKKRSEDKKSDLKTVETAQDNGVSETQLERAKNQEPEQDHEQHEQVLKNQILNSMKEQNVDEDEKVTEKPSSIQKNSALNTSLSEKVVHLRISLVEPKRDQPRKYFDDQSIEELADSISQFGIISPLLVQKKDDYYEIIAGERRWRAAKRAGLKEVPVIIKDLSDREAVEISLIENIQREDLNPMEESRAYERLVKEYGLSQEEVAKRVSRSRSAVTNSMRLLKLQPSVQKMVESGSLSEGHARTIVSIADPVLQEEVAEQVIESNLSVRQTEMLVKSLQKSNVPHKRKRDPRRETLLQDLAEHLKSKLGTKVSIRPSGKNKGKIEIEYYSDEELDRIYELLQSVRQEG